MTKYFSALFRGFGIWLLPLCLTTGAAASYAHQDASVLRGQVSDESGGVIVGATVTLTDSAGAAVTLTTDEQGEFSFLKLRSGDYAIQVEAPGFASFESPKITVSPGMREKMRITLKVAVADEVKISADAPLSTAPENNAGAVVIKGKDLDALPDDPDDLQSALQALAGPAAGPNGGQIFVDGFSGGRLPSKESIREVRINQNPFAAEYDQLGFGRIEILTKPGSDTLRGSAFFNFSDESFNSRNPFIGARAPYQQRFYGGNLGGPIVKGKASFFVDFERNEVNDNANINAVRLSDALVPTSFTQAVVSPSRRIEFSPRFDYQISQNHTLVGRYSFSRQTRQNAGLGNFTLPEQAIANESRDQRLQLTETAILSPSAINETRFQYLREVGAVTPGSDLPAINVLGAFVSGGAQTGRTRNLANRFELSNFTTLTRGNHTFKFGGRYRYASISDVSPTNFGGTFLFAGGVAPQLDGANQPVPGTLTQITSIERFRRTLLGQRLGFTPEQIRAIGGGPTQLNISGGDPRAEVTQHDVGVYFQDDWKARQNLTVSYGLRYENQTNIQSAFNFAPRLGLAWSLGGGNGQPAKTVIRAGSGIFYNRINENLTLQESRFNGVTQQQLIVTDAAALDGFPNIPSVSALAPFARAQTVRRLSDEVQSPYSIQSIVSLERQLPKGVVFAATYLNVRTVHVLRTRNANAPLPGTFNPLTGDGAFPLGAPGNVFEFESSGVFRQNQLIVNLRTGFNRFLTLSGTYILAKAESDTDGVGTFPANSFDLDSEFGRSSLDIRHRAFIFGNFTLPRGFSISPFLVVRSGAPFNITTGRDTNGDTLFTERPAIATDLAKPGVVRTSFGAFDPNPAPGQAVIPRNFAQGPGFATVNLRISKTFGFGGAARGGRGQSNDGGGRTGGPGGGVLLGGPGGGRGQGRGGFGGAQRSDQRVSMTFSVSVQNIFNRVNLSSPIGNLTSPSFGQSIATAGGFGFGPDGNVSAGNRRISMNMRLNF
jgi:hypothetical protein